MNSDKQNINIAILITTVLFANTVAQWVVDDYGCRTPSGSTGDCINIHNCKPIMEMIRQSQPLTQNLIEYVKSLHCGYEGSAAKVCCSRDPPPVQTKAPVVNIAVKVPDTSQHKNLKLLPEDCGPLNGERRIFGGNATAIFQYPWMALLSYRIGTAIDFRCGGTIINDRYILTAAHCITSLNNNMQLIGIRLGEHNIATKRDCAEIRRGVLECAPPVQDIAVEKSIPHPEYDPNTHANDIGLVRLASSANTAVENVKPICLPVTEELRNIDYFVANFTVTGWGIIDLSRRKSPQLLQANIPIISDLDCRKAYQRTNAVINDNHLCAGSKTSDSCGGDSGGPLQKPVFFNDDVRYIQYGIVSFGPQACGMTRIPGVYTRLDRYLNWILDTIRP